MRVAGLSDTVPTARRLRTRSAGVTVQQWMDYGRPDMDDDSSTATTKSDKIYLPFNSRNLLYEYVCREFRTNPHLLSFAPVLSTFYEILRHRDMQKLVFQKVVQLGRCPTCMYLKALIARSFGPERVRFLFGNSSLRSSLLDY